MFSSLSNSQLPGSFVLNSQLCKKSCSSRINKWNLKIKGQKTGGIAGVVDAFLTSHHCRPSSVCLVGDQRSHPDSKMRLKNASNHMKGCIIKGVCGI